MRLSRNFTLSEFLASETAEKKGGSLLEQQQTPPKKVVDALLYLVEESIQPLRNLLKTSIFVTSGYRCSELNSLVGGSTTSQHCHGEAADIKLSETFTHFDSRARRVIGHKITAVTQEPLKGSLNANFYLFAAICLYLDDLDVDQVIHEFGSDGRPAWIHLAASQRRNRRQILIKRHDEAFKTLTLEQALMLGCKA